METTKFTQDQLEFDNTYVTLQDMARYINIAPHIIVDAEKAGKFPPRANPNMSRSALWKRTTVNELVEKWKKRQDALATAHQIRREILVFA